MKEHLEHLRREGKRSGGMRSLMAAVVIQAARDAAGRDCGEAGATRAMAFILGDRCRLLCLELGIDHGALRENAGQLYRRLVLKPARRFA